MLQTNFDPSNLLQNGVTSGLPYLAMALMAVCWGALVDRLHAKKFVSLLTVRKASTACGKLL